MMANRIILVLVFILAFGGIALFSFGLYSSVVRNSNSYSFSPDGTIFSDPQSEDTLVGSSSVTTPSMDSKKNINNFLTGTIVAQELQVPVGVIALAEGNFSVVSRNGQVFLLSSDQSLSKLGLIPDVINDGELGVVGVTGLKEIKTKDKIEFYTLFSYRSSDGQIFNKVSKINLVSKSGQEGDYDLFEDVLIDQIPTSHSNNSGFIKLGPDEALWVGTGDGGKAVLVQDSLSKAGKILRLTADGKIPADNPTNNSYIYASGLRRPMGIAWNDKNEGFIVDSGNNGFDELNKLKPNANYGWPVVGGCWSDDKNLFVDPLVCSGSKSWSPSGLDWLGFRASSSVDVFVMSGLSTKNIYKIEIPRATTTGYSVSILLNDLYGRLRGAALLFEDLWVFTSNRDSIGTPNVHDDKVIRFNISI